MHLRKEVRKPELMADYTTFKGVEPERVPATYYVPAQLKDALDKPHRARHRHDAAEVGDTVAVEEFRITAASPPPHHFRITTSGRSRARGCQPNVSCRQARCEST